MKFYDPDENETLKSAMISILLLDTIINMCDTMHHTFTSYWAQSTAREELGGGPENPLRKIEMQVCGVLFPCKVNI